MRKGEVSSMTRPDMNYGNIHKGISLYHSGVYYYG